MLHDLRKFARIWILGSAVGIGLPAPAIEAASPQDDPENLASAIFLTSNVKPEFLYCFVDIEFFSYPDTENCSKSRTGLSLLAKEMTLANLNMQDDEIFRRVLSKLFNIYNERLSHSDR